MKEIDVNKRIEYFDLLRILAVFAVIVLHVSAQNWYYTDVHSFEWNVFNVYDSLVRWAVPVFVMISGALFLSKDYSIKKIYSVNIFRIVISFIFWSLVYSLIFNVIVSDGPFFTDFFTGYYHMWFMIMIVCLYMLVPVLKKIVLYDDIIKYLIVICFVFCGVLPLISKICLEFDNRYLNLISNVINKNLSNVNLNFGYIGYFLLGYCLYKVDFSKKNRYIIYGLGILGFLFTVFFTIFSSFNAGIPVATYYNNLYINVVLQSVALFVFAKYNFCTNKYLKYVSNLCFGIYLSHASFIELFNILFDINSLSFNPVMSVLLLSITIFFICLLLSFILKKIPVLRKYIV